MPPPPNTFPFYLSKPSQTFHHHASFFTGYRSETRGFCLVGAASLGALKASPVLLCTGLVLCFGLLLSLFVPFLFAGLRVEVCIAMADEERKGKAVREEEDVVTIEEEETEKDRGLTMCLMGKVATGKPFNAFGFLEVMKRAMNPSNGFTAKEIGPNLFSFHFNSHEDLLEVKKMEPWHFEKNLVLLKEIEKGEQPLTVSFTTINMWVRLYDRPMYLSESESGHYSTPEDRPKDPKQGWNMKRECDFVTERKELLNIHEDKLPFGKWIKASPAKKASVTTVNMKAEIAEEDKGVLDNLSKVKESPAEGVIKLSKELERVAVNDGIHLEAGSH
ncbi:hypothetical protein ACS0TY_014190 [Phlomoides rotata]